MECCVALRVANKLKKNVRGDWCGDDPHIYVRQISCVLIVPLFLAET